ncbi:MAG: hypothetical protein ACKN92_05300, partial [Candidatus Nanopelagicaceae bacterium]
MSAEVIQSSRQRLEEALAGDSDLPALLDRFDRWSQDLWDGLAVVYDAPTYLSNDCLNTTSFLIYLCMLFKMSHCARFCSGLYPKLRV